MCVCVFAIVVDVNELMSVSQIDIHVLKIPMYYIMVCLILKLKLSPPPHTDCICSIIVRR